jgi:eukaryotic-like serine/threonine-protein kinase
MADDAVRLEAALSDRYRIDREAGAGGMATVYLAEDLRHRRRVALKVLRPELAAILGPERFLAEINVTANLQHPHLLPLFDSGEADGLLFYVMPFVEGETLRARLQRERQLPVDEAIRITVAVAGALDYAHRQGVVHRDLKPENILLQDGQPLVADFGIALAVSNAGGARVTQTGLSLGTPQYMSPEQATGDRAVDARSDIYSLAAILYEMLVGDPPHTASTTQALIAKVLTERPPGVRAYRDSVPGHVDAALRHALAKLPADRFASAGAFADALTGARPIAAPTDVSAVEAAGEGGGGASRPVRLARWRWREAAAWVLAAAGLASAVAMSARGNAPAPPGRFLVQIPDGVTLPASSGPHVALSPDGSRLAVVGNLGAESHVYVRRMEDPVMEPVRGTEGATALSFSPDGEWLLFRAGGLLRRVPVGGGTPQTVTDNLDNAASWGDGGIVVFERSNAIWVTSVDGADARQVVAPDSASGVLRYYTPSMLPGGRYAIVTLFRASMRLESATLALLSLRDGRITELDIVGSNAHYSSTGHIIFGRANGLILAVPFSLRRRQVTGQPFVLLDGVAAFGTARFQLAVSRNGSIAYLAGGNSRLLSVYAVSLDGAERVLSREPNAYEGPRVSPDGRRIALNISTTATNADIWLLDRASGGLSRLTADSTSTRKEWSRDGSRLLFISARTERERMVKSMAPDRPGIERTEAGAQPTPIWEIAVGPAGGWSALRRGNSGANPDIYIAPTDSLDAMRPFAATPAREVAPRVSPDGRLLAWASDETGRPEVYVAPLPGPGPRLLVSLGGGTEPHWSPDGRTLYYRDPRNMMAARITADAAPSVSERTELFADRYSRNEPHAEYDVLPDGSGFIMTRSSSTSSDLYVLVNWPKLATGATGRGTGR